MTSILHCEYFFGFGFFQVKHFAFFAFRSKFKVVLFLQHNTKAHTHQTFSRRIFA